MTSRSFLNALQFFFFQVSDEIINNPDQVLMHWVGQTSAQELILGLQPLRQVNNQLLTSLVHAYEIAQSLGKKLRLSSVSVELRMALELIRLDQGLDYVKTCSHLRVLTIRRQCFYYKQICKNWRSPGYY